MNNKIFITFMRHGRSRADDEEVHEGRYDSPLTDTGRAQVQARAKDFLSRSMQFNRIIASPLLRAHETANIISRALNTPVETDEDWMEMDNGPLAGLPFDVAEQCYPTPAFRNPYQPFCDTGESGWELYCRAARAVEKVIRRGAGSYLVVAHGGILNAAMTTIVGAHPSSSRSGVVFGFGDTGYIQTMYDPSQHLWRILAFTPG